jgi:UDP-N-acetylglucosamine diphosphorylase / glucose-1-phosphate thymidylyltransferase / UDP-N-acetylgalactosamine diphosphorylase / glucosamine-1-phosphate N-acetyltransferase / galactosamine-1-phosphate N-acetyltransferase
MSNLLHKNFFNIKNFKFSFLWEENKPLWQPLLSLSVSFPEINLGKIEIKIQKEVYLIDPHLISIGKGSVVEPGVFIKGPCIIGENCHIRHGAYLRGNIITGNNCVIGHTTEMKNTIFLDNVHAAHFAYIGDSIIGNNVNLGAGVKCANYRLDKSEIVIRENEKKIFTGLRKFGAIIGDNSQVGCNSVLNPGSILGKGVICYPSLNIGGIIPENSTVKNRPQSFEIQIRD